MEWKIADGIHVGSAVLINLIHQKHATVAKLLFFFKYSNTSLTEELKEIQMQYTNTQHNKLHTHL